MQPKFTWGPVARGVYIAMLWFTVVIGWHFPNYLTYYIPLVIFLGIGLRPLIEVSGLYDVFENFMVSMDERKWKKINEQKCFEANRKERDKKYRNSRIKDPKLPKNW